MVSDDVRMEIVISLEHAGVKIGDVLADACLKLAAQDARQRRTIEARLGAQLETFYRGELRRIVGVLRG